MRKMLLVAGMMVACGAAHAQSVPHFNVESACKEVATNGGLYSHTTYVDCVDMEQDSYQKVKNRWFSTSGEIRAMCLDLVKTGGLPMYSNLSDCIDMEEDSKEKSHTKRFEY